MERAKRRAAERRTRSVEAERAFSRFLERIAMPLFRQVANVLRSDGYLFNVFTPSGAVRLMSDRHAEDFIEIVLDTSDPEPRVVGRTSRRVGNRVVESEKPIGEPASLTEEELLGFLLKELEPFVER